MGWPANLDFDVELPSQELQLRATADSVEVFLARAQRAGSDVAAARAGAEQARHRICRVWDGRDHEGAAAGSGVYFYRLRAGELVESKKMVLSK